jgi:DNA-binding MarR family transcriptional regulator
MSSSPRRPSSMRRPDRPGPPAVTDRRPGFELPLLLLAGFRVLIDELHAELRQQGHPDLRPSHGFVLQAIGRYGTTAADLGRRLGVSKQAAGKTIDNLQQIGYVIRVPDTVDQRQKIVVLTDFGVDALQRSAAIFEQLRAGWADALGADRLQALETDLETVTGDVAFQLDTPGWFGAG